MTKDEKIDLIVKAAVLCNEQRDPLEVAMLNWATVQLGKSQAPNHKSQTNPKHQITNHKQKIDKIRAAYPRVDEIPFSPEYKYIATLHEVKRVDKVAKVDDNNWLIQSTSTEDIRPKIFAFAVSSDLAVLSMQKKEKSLEEVFQELTK